MSQQTPKLYNIAFIDGQNLHLWIKSEWRAIDFKKFRIFLKDKFQIEEAYYFLGCVDESEQDLYDNIQKAWFIMSFREHTSALKGKKKGNVDVDIVFSMMKKLIDDPKGTWNKMVLVSWDGDYKKVVDYLIKKWVFEKIIFPNANHSSLYNKLGNTYYYYLKNAQDKISYQKKHLT